MINPGYKISVQDIKELREFKRSEAYSTYLKAISKSPAYISIMDEHINNIDISEDVSKLKKEGQLGPNIRPEALALLFKESLSRMAICILADAIILKELEDCKVDTILNDLKKDSDIMYLLGQADKKYYVQAARLVEEGELNSNTLAFRGLMAYMKIHNKEFKEPHEACKTLIQERQPTVLDSIPEVKSRKKISSIDLDSDDIRL